VGGNGTLRESSPPSSFRNESWYESYLVYFSDVYLLNPQGGEKTGSVRFTDELQGARG